MNRALDWDSFVRQHWEKAPTRLSLGRPVLPPEQVFKNVITASAPFRHGTRFRPLQDVKFFVDDAQLRSPGALFPGDGDPDAAAYVRRASAELGGGFQVLIEQPFLSDFAPWDGLRTFVRGLLERVGVPVLPIVSDVFVGNFARSPQGVAKRYQHAVFTLVLQGRLRVRVWKKLWGTSPTETVDFERHRSEAETLEAKAGDVLYVPSRAWQLEECRGSCMAVRLWIPVQGSRSTDAVKDVLVRLLDARLPHDHSVPYFDYPWRRPRGNAGTHIDALGRAAEAMESLTRGPDLLQALRIIWARRVSACGLEPAPPPLEVPPLEDDQLVRGATRGRLVRMQDSPGEFIGALNGHAFPMTGNRPVLALLQALDSGGAQRVGELCGLAKRGAERKELRELLELFQALRGLEVVTGKGG